MPYTYWSKNQFIVPLPTLFICSVMCFSTMALKSSVEALLSRIRGHEIFH